MKFTNKKRGFTIVELIIVIAVIAVLAAVLIPVFSGLIQQGKDAEAKVVVNTLNKGLAMTTTKPATMQSALEAVETNVGINVAKLNETYAKTGNQILWDSKIDSFLFVNGDNRVYAPEVTDPNTAKIDLWAVATTEAELSTEYSNYYAGSDLNKAITVTTGFDAGVAVVDEVKYEKTDDDSAQEKIIIRTNGGALTISAKNDNVFHYGKASKVTVEKVKSESYHEFGTVYGNIYVNEGHVSLENASTVNSIVITANTLDSVSVTQKSGATIEKTIIALEDSVKEALKTSDNIKVADTVKESIDNVAFATADNFESLIGTGKYIVLSSDVTVSKESTLQIISKNADIDLNGFTLEIKTTGTNSQGLPLPGISLTSSSNVNISNGNLVINGSVDSPIAAMFIIEKDSKCTMSNVSFTTRSAGLFLDKQSEVALKSCKIKAACYDIGTNASTATASDPALNIYIADSILETTSDDSDNVSVCINIPAVLYAENSKFSGQRQGVMVRGATATFINCYIESKGTCNVGLKYYDTNWKSGNEVPQAALVVGNRSTNAYKYNTNVTLRNTKLANLGGNSGFVELYAFATAPHTVSISYDSTSILRRTNLSATDIGPVTVTTIK